MMANGGSGVGVLGVHGFWKSPNGSNRMSVQYKSYIRSLTDKFENNCTTDYRSQIRDRQLSPGRDPLTGVRVSLSAARPRRTDPKTPIYPTYVGIVGISILIVQRRSTTSSTMALSRRPRTMADMATDGRLAIGHRPGSLEEVVAEGGWAGFS